MKIAEDARVTATPVVDQTSACKLEVDYSQTRHSVSDLVIFLRNDLGYLFCILVCTLNVPSVF